MEEYSVDDYYSLKGYWIAGYVTELDVPETSLITYLDHWNSLEMYKVYLTYPNGALYVLEKPFKLPDTYLYAIKPIIEL
jgi:hypothetical protein